jgi:predicted nucleic-acid-binding protein
VKIAADTNVLLRAVIGDDEGQAAVARTVLANAELVAIPISAFCELVWVLGQSYRVSAPDIVAAVRVLLASGNVVVDRPAVEAGLRLLEAGGDFADGLIAYEGRWLGAEVFVSFDRRAVKLLAAAGEKAELLA